MNIDGTLTTSRTPGRSRVVDAAVDQDIILRGAERADHFRPGYGRARDGSLVAGRAPHGMD